MDVPSLISFSNLFFSVLSAAMRVGSEWPVKRRKAVNGGKDL